MRLLISEEKLSREMWNAMLVMRLMFAMEGAHALTLIAKKERSSAYGIRV